MARLASVHFQVAEIIIYEITDEPPPPPEVAPDAPPLPAAPPAPAAPAPPPVFSSVRLCRYCCLKPRLSRKLSRRLNPEGEG